MHVLVFEPGILGHRLHHVRLLVDALAALPVQTTLCLAAAAPASPELAVHLQTLPANATLEATLTPPAGGFFKRALHGGRELRAAIERHRPQHVYVPSGDGLSQMLALSRLPKGTEAEAMLLRGAFVYPQPSRRAAFKAQISWRAAKRAPWSRVHLLDPLVYEQVAAHDRAFAARCDLMPDPVETPRRDDRRAARRELGLGEDGRWLAVVGLINNRKGCDRLIEAFVAAKLNPDDRMLLAGKIDAETQPLLQREPAASLVRGGRIVCLNRMLAHRELLTAIEAADLIAAFYPRHVGSASLVIRAAAQNRPVLASDYGWSGVIVPRFNLGLTIDADNAAALPAAIATALQRSSDFQLSEIGRRFVSFHRVENFQAHWTDALRRLLSLPRSDAFVPWESVA